MLQLSPALVIQKVHYILETKTFALRRNNIHAISAKLLFLAGSFKRRKRKSVIVTVMLLIVSVLILVFGLAATTRTQNITVGGYYSGVIVSTHSRRPVAATDAAQQACSLSGCMISEVTAQSALF